MAWQQLPDPKAQWKLSTPYRVLSLLVFVTINLSIPLVIEQIVVIDYHWYEQLIKPAFTPPAWFFSQRVWIVLDILIALSGWLVCVEGRFHGVHALVYIVQCVAHFAWMPVFFAARQLLLALLDSVLQWFTLVCGVLMYRRINVWASLLLVPALMWVSLAASFNAALWYLNQK